jgi:hypothetical protein
MTDPQNLPTAYTYDVLNRLATLAFNGQTAGGPPFLGFVFLSYTGTMGAPPLALSRVGGDTADRSSFVLLYDHFPLPPFTKCAKDGAPAPAISYWDKELKTRKGRESECQHNGAIKKPKANARTTGANLACRQSERLAIVWTQLVLLTGEFPYRTTICT